MHTPTVRAALTAAVLGISATAAQAHDFNPATAGALLPVGHHAEMPTQAAPMQRPRLGIAISAISQQDLAEMGLEYGVRVDEVRPGSVAAGAGVQSGDTVTGVDGRPAYSPERLQYLVRDIGDQAALELVRDGDRMTLPVQFNKPKGPAALGVRIQAMTDDLKQAFGADDGAGVLIAQVDKHSASAAAGLKAGDVIVGIDDTSVASVVDVRRAVRSHAPGDTVGVTILRDRQQQRLDVALGEAAKPDHAGKRGYGMHGHPDHGKYHGHGKYGKEGHCDMHKRYRAS